MTTLGDLPITLSMIASLDAKSLSRRVELFEKKHSRPPNDESTLREWCMVSRRTSDRMKLISTFLVPACQEQKQTINHAFVQLAMNVVGHALSIVQEKTPRDYTAKYAVDAAKQWLINPSKHNQDRAYASALSTDHAARLAESNSLSDEVVHSLNACSWAARAAADQYDDCLFYAMACVRTVEYDLRGDLYTSDTIVTRLLNQMYHVNHSTHMEHS